MVAVISGLQFRGFLFIRFAEKPSQRYLEDLLGGGLCVYMYKHM